MRTMPACILPSDLHGVRSHRYVTGDKYMQDGLWGPGGGASELLLIHVYNVVRSSWCILVCMSQCLNLDSDIEKTAKSCLTCQENQKIPAKAPLHPWEWPDVPWFRLHADYAGPFCGKMFLLVIDAHSKWLDVHCVQSATSAVTIDKLRSSFATHGIPNTLVTDNGSVFTSAEFEHFLRQNGV